MDEEIFKTVKDRLRAESLKDMALDRLKDIKKETKIYRIVEQYYEIIKELITSIMYLDGYKTLSHKALVEYIKENYSKELNNEELILIDELRKIRNEILYYGKQIEDSFLLNKNEIIINIINNLLKIIEHKLKCKL